MTKIFSAAALLIMSAAPLMAQYSNPRITAFGGLSFFGGDRAFVSGGEAFQTEYKTSGKIGGRFTVDLTDRWAAEASYSFGGSDLRVIELQAGEPERVYDMRLHQFVANGLYYFAPPDEVWRPFLTFGLGLAHFSPTGDAKALASARFLETDARISSSSKFEINFGGGAERRLTDLLGLRFEIRDHIIGIPRYGLPEEPLNQGGVSYPVSGAIQNWEISAGVVFHLR